MRDFTGAGMQKLHLKMRNLPNASLQMRLPAHVVAGYSTLATVPYRFVHLGSANPGCPVRSGARTAIGRTGDLPLRFQTASRPEGRLPNVATRFCLCSQPACALRWDGPGHRRERSRRTGPQPLSCNAD